MVYAQFISVDVDRVIGRNRKC